MLNLIKEYIKNYERIKGHESHTNIYTKFLNSCLTSNTIADELHPTMSEYMQNDKKIEVEVRGLLSKREYSRVVEKLKKEGELVKNFKRILIAYSTFTEGNTSDIRCRITDDEPELIAKVGEQSSLNREEIEVKLAKGAFVDAVKFMKALGYSKGIISLRLSERYMFKGVEFTIVRPIIIRGNLKKVHSIYYEAEKLSDEKDIEDAKANVVSVIDELKLKIFAEHKKDIESSNLLSKSSFYEYVEQLNKEANAEADFTKDGYTILNNVLEISRAGLDKIDM